ncbi:hypothetical protein HID58_080989 [Brassica napus]|uniref:Aspergillus nuclease S1 n=1 Tax=Brassica napus TaxID=3708 RepID=A0ABQ7Y6G6_BRANA|nr:hypothetical protein HID58_080989 [Brassica napus]
MASAFRSPTRLIFVFGVMVLCSVSPVRSWSKEGHILTCRIAQKLLEAGPAHAVENLLPDYAKGDLSALCVWPDQIRHWYKYRWTSPLHFIDTPDHACSYEYSRDCHDQHGLKDMCVDGAIQNFTSQLQHYGEGTSDRRYNMTEALLFLSHFMGDIHQPMHVGFTSDEGGNTIDLRWYRHKSNLHHVRLLFSSYKFEELDYEKRLPNKENVKVWDREIILTALKEYYDKDLDLLQEDLEKNITNGLWHDDLSSWTECNDLIACPHKYASESIQLACKYGYEGVKSGETLSEDYFDTRMPIVMKRIVQGGVRLAMILNRVFSDTHADVAAT